MEPAIRVEHLHKRYGDLLAVEDVSFEVMPGEIFGLLGPNGAGKTTTVECLQGLRRPDSGTGRVAGLDPVRDVAELRRRIGSQLQESALPHRLKVGEAIRLFASLSDRGADWRSLLADWGLEDKARTPFGELSGGQRQRLFVALALVNDPEVVFLDEMTTGLDPAARRTAWTLIERIRGRGTTVVLVTHFMDEAEALCDRVAVVASGRIVADGTPGDLVAAHAGTVEVRCTLPAGVDVGFLDDVPGADRVRREASAVVVEGTGPLLVRVAAALSSAGLEPADLRADLPTLEDVYLALTAGAEVR